MDATVKMLKFVVEVGKIVDEDVEPLKALVEKAEKEKNPLKAIAIINAAL